MRISDWSSDVCSSDLQRDRALRGARRWPPFPRPPAARQTAQDGQDRAGPLHRARGRCDLGRGGLACGEYASRSTTSSEEHTSELQSLMRISYAVFCLKKKKKTT